MTIDYRDFGQRVRALRRAKGLTQEDLAQKTGISPSFLGHIERGSRICSLETLCALCNVLETNPHYLLASGLESEIGPGRPSPMDEEHRRRLRAFLQEADQFLKQWEQEPPAE